MAVELRVEQLREVAADGRSVVLSGGMIADGSGEPIRAQDVLLESGRIAALGPWGSFAGTDAIDVAVDGCIVAPGFVDVHSHADNAPLLDSDDTTKVMQGVTTEVVGNCGFSLAPVDRAHANVLGDLLYRIFPRMQVEWASVRELFRALDASGYVTNYVPLIGHNTLRVAVLGSGNRTADESELRQMQRLLEDSLSEGACGLSSGLIYPPGMFAERAELIGLAQVLGSDGIYATHMRDEAGGLCDSISEAVSVGENTGCRVQISHLKAAGRPNWGRVECALSLLRRARERGVDVAQDVYPYDAASTMLASCLPPWSLVGDDVSVLTRLRDPGVVERLRGEVEAGPTPAWENTVSGAGWEGILIASTADHRYEGLNLSQIGASLSLDPFDALVRVLREEKLRASMIIFDMSEADVETVMRDPATMIGSDGLPPGVGGKPHPRLYGTFPRVLQRYVRERGLLSLPVAIAKMTSVPARTFGLKGRGRVAEGDVADLVVFSAESIRDNATYADPVQGPTGVLAVLIAGRPVVVAGEWLGRRLGRRLTG